MKYKTILLDADNTFFDFDKTEYSALTELSKWANYDDSFLFIDKFMPINRALWLGLERGEVKASDINRLRFDGLIKELDLNSDAKIMADKYINLLSSGSFFIEGAVEMLDKLVRDFTLVVITNGLSKVQRGRLKKNNMEHYFSVVAISEELGCSKPSVKFFEETIKLGKLGKKSEMIVVGDNISSDIAGANNFGVDSIWFNPTSKQNSTTIKPTHEVSALSQIYPLLKSKK